MTRRQIATRVAGGEYQRLHLGVYLIVPFLLQHSREMAAVLACGPGAALSHFSAAYVYKMLPYPAHPGPVHVAVPGDHTRRLKDVHVHRAQLKHWETRERYAMPVTAPIRTIVDLAGCVADDELEHAVAEAIALRLTTRDALVRALPSGRRGVTRLRALLDAGPQRTRSTPERILLDALRSAGIGGFLTNEPIGRWEVDFYWPAKRVAIEVDAYSTHSSPTAFERDRRKDAKLAELGITVRRVTADQVRGDIDEVVELVRKALGAEEAQASGGGSGDGPTKRHPPSTRSSSPAC